MEELIQRCRQGDRASMGQLYTAMHDELLAQCQKYVGNDDIAHDLLHDAFLLIFSHIGQLRSAEKGRQWMHKVVRNVCLLYVQNRQNHNLVPIEEVRETMQGPEPDSAVSYDEIVNAIGQLPDGYRQVFRLSVLEGLTHQQIAGLLGIEPHTSSSQLLRAKRQLRHLLQVLILLLLPVVPYGIYHYFHSSQDDKTEATPVTAQNESAEVTQKDSSHDLADTSANLVHKEPAPAVKSDLVAKSDSDEDMTIVESTHDLQHEAVNDTIHHPSSITHQPTPNTYHPTPITLSLAYSGLPNGTANQLPYGAEGMNGEIDSVTHHRMPVTIALNTRYQLSPTWWLDGGLRYTILSSETRVGNTYLMMEQQQRVRYLGFTLGVGRHLWHRRHWSIYATTSVGFELPLHSTVETSFWQGGQLIDKDYLKLTPNTQWSLGMGVGLQYNPTPAIGFFVEPSLQYYFRNSDDISTWRTKHPFTPILPIGIRIGLSSHVR